MQLFIAALDGRTLTLEIDGAATGASLKAAVAQRTGVAAAELRLSLGANAIDDEAPLDGQGITDKSTVQANGRVRGGGGMGNAIAGGVAAGVSQGVAQSCCTVV
jgi:hypothetical protein